MTEQKHVLEASAALQSVYAKPADLWRQFVAGGVIACKSRGAAISLRQRMYKARKLMQIAYGPTPYDTLVIKRGFNDHRLTICERDEGITELLPNDPLVEDEEFVGIAKQPSEQTKRQLDDLIDSWATSKAKTGNL